MLWFGSGLIYYESANRSLKNFFEKNLRAVRRPAVVIRSNVSSRFYVEYFFRAGEVRAGRSCSHGGSHATARPPDTPQLVSRTRILRGSARTAEPPVQGSYPSGNPGRSLGSGLRPCGASRRLVTLAYQCRGGHRVSACSLSPRRSLTSARCAMIFATSSIVGGRKPPDQVPCWSPIFDVAVFG